MTALKFSVFQTVQNYNFALISLIPDKKKKEKKKDYVRIIKQDFFFFISD